MADLIDRDALEPFYESGTDPNDTYADMTFIRAEHIENAPAVNRWIPVEDALPEEDVSVLCYMRIGEIVVMEYGGDGWYCGVTRYNPRVVTHWMPLPEPPEKE